MILRRDVLVSIVEGSSIQLVATPGAAWVRTVNPVLARNLIDENLLPAAGTGGRYWSPRGLYVTLVSALEDAEGNEALPTGAHVFVDPSSSLTLVGKAEAGRLPHVRNAHEEDAFIGGLLVLFSGVAVWRWFGCG